MKNCHDDYLFLKKKDKKNLLQIPNDIFLFFIRKLFLFQCELEFLNSVSLILVLYALFLVVYFWWFIKAALVILVESSF